MLGVVVLQLAWTTRPQWLFSPCWIPRMSQKQSKVRTTLHSDISCQMNKVNVKLN